MSERQTCPDEGACHHGCEPSACWRVRNAGPLSAAHYPGDRWPDEVKRAHGVEPEVHTEVDMVKLGEWVGQEQEHLWYDLEDALRLSRNGVWSGDAQNAMLRLYSLLQAGVEPTPWMKVPWLLTRSGLYSTLLHLSGCNYTGPTDQELVEVAKQMFPYTSDGNLALRQRSIQSMREAIAEHNKNEED